MIWYHLNNPIIAFWYIRTHNSTRCCIVNVHSHYSPETRRWCASAIHYSIFNTKGIYSTIALPRKEFQTQTIEWPTTTTTDIYTLPRLSPLNIYVYVHCMQAHCLSHIMLCIANTNTIYKERGLPTLLFIVHLKPFICEGKIATGASRHQVLSLVYIEKCTHLITPSEWCPYI